MDVTGIASLATSMAQAKNSDAINIAMLKKTLDGQTTLAAGLLDAVPPPSPPVTSSIGHNIDTTA